MAPFGYRIVNAEAVVDAEEADMLRDFFERIVAGGQLKASAQEAGLTKVPATCKKMLSNPVYVGTDYYPQIIPPELFEAAQESVRKLSREKKGGKMIPDLPVYTGFMAQAGSLPQADGLADMDPKEYAVRLFERIKAVW